MTISILIRWDHSNDWLRSPPYASREDADRDVARIADWIGRDDELAGIPWLTGRSGDEFYRAYVEDDTEIQY